MAHDPPPDLALARQHAHRRALRTAAALTLGLVSATVTGCEATTNVFCDVFPDTRTCCERSPGTSYDEATHRCIHYPPPLGPLVPPQAPV